MTFAFNRHPQFEGMHARISASKYHWLRYDDEKFIDSIAKSVAAARGSRLHDLAKSLIKEGVKLPNTQQTLNMYVNDAIGYRMSPEVMLFFSPDAFGTADAIDFSRDRLTDELTLRIFDLKTGVTPAKETQLEIYAALFCLEYRVRPLEITYDLRIYQNDDIEFYDTDPEQVVWIMSRIKEANELMLRYREAEGL